MARARRRQRRRLPLLRRRVAGRSRPPRARADLDRPPGTLPEPTDDDFPLTLTTAREADGYNTGVRSRGGEAGALVARIHPETVAEHSELVTDETLTVETRRGSATVDIDRDAGVPRGMVWLPIHHPATNRRRFQTGTSSPTSRTSNSVLPASLQPRRNCRRRRLTDTVGSSRRPDIAVAASRTADSYQSPRSNRG